jgi:transitional endoplasmic reticulum ATPase
MRDRPLAADITAAWLADQTEGFSGAEIEAVCRSSMMAVLAVRIGNNPDAPDASALEIRREHIEAALHEIAPRTARVEYQSI